MFYYRFRAAIIFLWSWQKFEFKILHNELQNGNEIKIEWQDDECFTSIHKCIPPKHFNWNLAYFKRFFFIIAFWQTFILWILLYNVFNKNYSQRWFHCSEFCCLSAIVPMLNIAQFANKIVSAFYEKYFCCW